MVALASEDDVAAVTSTPVPTDQSDTVLRLIEFASARVIRKLNRGPDPFTLRTEDLTAYARSTGELFLPVLNLTAIGSVALYGATLAEGSYRFTDSGRVYRLRGGAEGYWDGLGWDSAGRGDSCSRDDLGWPSGPVTFTDVTSGWAEGELPDDIVGMVAEIAGTKWLSGPTAHAGVKSEAIDTYSVSFDTSKANGGPDAAWSAEHLEILDSYRRRLTSVRVIDAGGSPVR